MDAVGIEKKEPSSRNSREEDRSCSLYGDCGDDDDSEAAVLVGRKRGDLSDSGWDGQAL